MKGILKLIDIIADAIARAIAFKRIRDERNEADIINVNPAGEWMRRFKRGQATSESIDKTKSGKSEGD